MTNKQNDKIENQSSTNPVNQSEVTIDGNADMRVGVCSTINVGDVGYYKDKLCMVTAILDDITIRVQGCFNKISFIKNRPHNNKLLAFFGIKQSSLEETYTVKQIEISIWNFKPRL